jgi:hypothetical protein
MKKVIVGLVACLLGYSNLVLGNFVAIGPSSNQLVASAEPAHIVASTQVSSKQKIDWKVEVTTAAGWDQLQVKSSSIQFVSSQDPSSGTVLGQKATTLSDVKTPSSMASSEHFRLSEWLVIPAEIMEKARRLGWQKVYAVREFSCTATANGSSSACAPNQFAHATILVSNSSSSASLSFSETLINVSTPQQLVLNEVSKASVTIRCNGRGTYRYWWEIRQLPQSKYAKPRTWKKHKVYTSSCEQLHLISPQLPTDKLGLYALRLRFDMPYSLTYEVAENNSIRPFLYRVIRERKVNVPSSDTGLENQQGGIKPTFKQNSTPIIGLNIQVIESDQKEDVVVIDWQAVGVASYYQVSLFKQSNEVLEQILAFKTNATQEHLSDAQMARLGRISQPVYWQIKAFDQQGNILGWSDMLEYIK